jgi:hypothetical protein
MVALEFSRTRKPKRAPWRLPERPVPLAGGRLPLGSFAQGRPLRRALAELFATAAVLAAVIAGFTLLQLNF